MSLVGGRIAVDVTQAACDSSLISLTLVMKIGQ